MRRQEFDRSGDHQCLRHGWLRLMIQVSAIACLLAAPGSQAQELPSQASDALVQAFNNACRTCHTIRDGDNRLGPNLYRIVGRQAGSRPNYSYSEAMKDAGFVWDEKTLARFIANPDDLVPGNRMKPYGGLALDEATKVVAYLVSITGRP